MKTAVLLLLFKKKTQCGEEVYRPHQASLTAATKDYRRKTMSIFPKDLCVLLFFCKCDPIRVD
jgi:hypothetical protein